ncbi:MAG TPA: TrmH family RNA methyltransferase [Acidimicrobiales bacterium]|nr:TrmH family RNA methyltransferase [Acidimicrobiales bacterium]
MSGTTKYRPTELRGQRRRAHGCWDHLIAAPLWVAYQANLGTLLRTCDAVGACLAVPDSPHYRRALATGNTLRRPSCIHWVRGGKLPWLERQRSSGSRVVAVELAEGARSLADLPAARQRTVVCLGHEHSGIPEETWALLDEVIQIPMVGSGPSLNVAVAGSLVLYRLAGLL